MKDEMNGLQSDNANIKAEVVSMKEELNNLRSENSNLKAEVNGLKQIKAINTKDEDINGPRALLTDDKQRLEAESQFKNEPKPGGKQSATLEGEIVTQDEFDNDTMVDLVRPSRLISGRRIVAKNTSKAKRFVVGQNNLEQGVAFSATVTQFDLNNLGQGQTIHFDKVISNLGNAYDSSVGIFRVPVTGWYVFSLTLMSTPNQTQELDVVVNGARIFHCYTNGNEYNTASRTIVAHVESGDNAWVQTAKWQHDDTVHGAEHTSFTAFLLYAD